MEANAPVPPKIEVRRLQSADLGLLMRVPDGVFDDPIVPARAAEFLGDRRHVLIAAIDGTAIVGFASTVIYVHPDKVAPEMWVNEIGVAHSYRRGGIGRRLMAEAMRIGRAEGCRQLWLLTESGNGPARALYRAVGAREVPDVVTCEIDLA